MLPADGALDVRLMRTLYLLLTECSVSRTADILGQTQPTVSLALKRLRYILGDPILVRSGSSLVPTERGLELRESVKRLLSDIDAHLSPSPNFDPTQSERRFHIVAANCLGAAFIPRIVMTVAQRAPKASVEFVQMPSHEDLKAQLADGKIDLVVGNWPNPPDVLHYAPLLSTKIKCVVNRKHPFAERSMPLSMEDYLEASHLSPTSDMMMQYSPIDGRLMELGLRRKITASVPEYAIAPHVLVGTDLVFTTGAPFANRIAEDPTFDIIDAPPEFGRMDFYLLWHDCKHRSPAHTWLRRLVREISNEMRSSDLDEDEPMRHAAE